MESVLKVNVDRRAETHVGDDYIGWWETEAQIEKIVLSHTEPKILAFNQSMWNRNTIKSMWVSDDAFNVEARRI